MKEVQLKNNTVDKTKKYNYIGILNFQTLIIQKSGNSTLELLIKPKKEAIINRFLFGVYHYLRIVRIIFL